MKKSPVILILVFALFSLSGLFSGCGPDDTPDPGNGGGDTTINTITEFLIIDGIRYESTDFVRKYMESNGGKKSLVIWLNTNYPYVRIKHEEDKDGNLVAHSYEISDDHSTGETFGYEVLITSADGPLPADCSFACSVRRSGGCRRI